MKFDGISMDNVMLNWSFTMLNLAYFEMIDTVLNIYCNFIMKKKTKTKFEDFKVKYIN